MSESGRPIVARWLDWDEQSVEHLELQEGRDGVIAESSLHGAFAARYRIVCDRTWRVREIQVRVIGSNRTLRLEGDGAGHWRDGSGAALPQLDGAIDVDLTVTPSPTPCRYAA